MTVEVNYLAVVVAAVVSMVLGYVWYGALFGKQWISMMKFTPEAMAEARAKGMGKTYALMFVGSLVMSYVLWHTIVFAIGFTQTSGAMTGVSTGFWMWLGFIAPVTLGSVLWEGKPWRLWILNIGYYLVTLVATGAILAAWM